MFLLNRQFLIKTSFFILLISAGLKAIVDSTETSNDTVKLEKTKLVDKKPVQISKFIEKAKPMANKLAKSELPAIAVAFLVRACYDRSFLPLGKFADNCLPGMKDAPLSDALTTELTCATIELLMNAGGSFVAERLNLKTDDEFEENAFVDYLFDILGECAETAGDYLAPETPESRSAAKKTRFDYNETAKKEAFDQKEKIKHDEDKHYVKKEYTKKEYQSQEKEDPKKILKDLANTIVIQKTLPTLIKKLASHPSVANKLCSDAEKAIFVLTKYILPKAKLHGLIFCGTNNYKKSAKNAFVKWAGDTVLEKIRTKERINKFVQNKHLNSYLNRCIGTTLGMYLSHYFVS